jgi:serine/threonine-protein kinase
VTAEALQLPELGEVVGEGRFELLRQLGEGGMSTVFVAVDRFLGREVALKLLTPRYVGRPEREQRLLNEAEYLRRVQGHPHIVQFIDSGRLRDRDDWPWLTTEILQGEVLALLFMHGKIEIPRVVTIARQVAVAVNACHAAGIVHRDITPNNVFMLEDRRTAKLFDFSHAADLRAPRVAAGAPERLTGVFDTPGTIGYMGPEQVHNAPPEVSMDAFGFGVLLFKLVTGRHPYRQFTDRDEFIKAQREGTLEPPRLHAWAYDAPEGLADLLHDCTQREAEKRPSMAEVVARLDVLELPSVQDDDATSFYRPPAVSVSREAPEQETLDVTVGVDAITTAFEPSRAPAEAGQHLPEVTARVDAPTLLHPRRTRTAPREAIGDWVVAAPVTAAAVVSVATEVLEDELEERTAIQLPFARPPHLREEPMPHVPQPEPQLAFARPPEHRPPSPIEVAEPQSHTIETAAPPAPAPVEAEDDQALAFLVTRRRLLLRLSWLLIGVLLVLVWFVVEARTRQPSGREQLAPTTDTGEMSAPPGEPEVTPDVDDTGTSGPALEPVPEVEPIEDSAPELEPEPKSKPKPKQKPNPSESAVKPECDGVEQKARAAEDKADWRQVASLTARKECWSSAKERTSLRIRAMFELGNWKECAALGESATEPSLEKYIKQCQSLSKQGSP